jgi:hypothetical protein
MTLTPAAPRAYWRRSERRRRPPMVTMAGADERERRARNEPGNPPHAISRKLEVRVRVVRNVRP